MNKSRFIGASSAIVFSLIAVSANAALVGRLPATPGGDDFQAAYDDVLDITWATNANLRGFNTAGPWDDLTAWASGLDYLGFDDWRLASVDVNGDTAVIDCNGATEQACRDNEMGYMFYQHMGGTSGTSEQGDQTVDGVLLTNVTGDMWTDTEIDADHAYTFFFRLGSQHNFLKTVTTNGWAVRVGDVSAVPVPAAVWLFGSGLLGLIGVARRKKA
jgi:hypothetical protein